MAEIEKVIKGLEDAWHTLEEWDNGNEEFICVQLVKDQIFYALALLKEQEAVKPKQEKAVLDYQSWHYVCGDCEKPIDIQDNFCRHCGRQIEHT